MGLLEPDAMAQLHVGQSLARSLDVDARALSFDLDAGRSLGAEREHPGCEGALVEASISNQIVVPLDLGLGEVRERDDLPQDRLAATTDKGQVVDPDVEARTRPRDLKLDAVERGGVDAPRPRGAPTGELRKFLEAEHVVLPLLGQLDIGPEVVEALRALAGLGAGGAVGHLQPKASTRSGRPASEKRDALVARSVEPCLRFGEVETQAGEGPLLTADASVHTRGVLGPVRAAEAHREHPTVGTRGGLDLRVASAEGVDVAVSIGLYDHLVVVVLSVLDHSRARARDGLGRSPALHGRRRLVRTHERAR